MRRIAVLVLVAGVALPAAWSKPPVTQLITVAQLEQLMASTHGSPDGTAAKELSGVRLSQRLSNTRLAKLNLLARGKQSREQLLVLADESQFMVLPSEDTIPDPVPDGDAQKTMLARTVAYFKQTMQEWPSFSALRAVTRFEGTATLLAGGLQDDLGTRMGAQLLRSPAAPNWECPGPPRLPTRRLDVIERATLQVIYRRGHALHAFSPGGEFACAQHGVNTSDEFGEMQILVPLVAREGKAVWSHWEESSEGKIAVFRFSASVTYAGSGPDEERLVDLSGELGLNPRDGSIVRLVEMRRWEHQSVMREYDTAVEFGAIALEGMRLLLPVRRVAMFQTPILKPPTWDATIEGYYRKFHLEKSPLQEYLNDVTFGEYRPFTGPQDGAGSAAASVAANRR
jgi:hypothetical protein